MDPVVKVEMADAELPLDTVLGTEPLETPAMIDLSSSSSSDSDGEDGCVARRVMPRVPNGDDMDEERSLKKRRSGDGAGVVALPPGFLEPLPLERPRALSPTAPISVVWPSSRATNTCRQFWKAGDYAGGGFGEQSSSSAAGLDHARVHPKFLHSNATSHKWALGAIAELLDNALDEVCNGATFVKIEMLENKKDKTRMLLVEDNGGGMDPDTMRHCMSLGYSAKSKLANTIGQYGNGFKTSTMRLGADVIVFSRCGKGGKRSTQSIGMLSYTFLRNTGKEDTVVPMLDYEKGEENWNKLVRSSSIDWNKNLDTIVQWSPYWSEADLLQQFESMADRGTRVIIYNLWEDDEGELELDFDADKYDIQLRGANRDEKKIQMAKQFPNSRHFLTYRHSLRSYASILYFRLPQRFKMILRGKEIEHHNIVNDMMLKQEVTYKPHSFGDGASAPRDQNVQMVAIVTIGFVKDAKDHVDVQGFNVYHKNRLIKPFWRVWNAAGSDGRGVIGVLEANFIEPAHDKQGFERTTVLSRLEARLIQMQRNYWRTQAHKIGYAPRVKEKLLDSIMDREFLPETSPSCTATPVGKSHDSTRVQISIGKISLSPVESNKMADARFASGHSSFAGVNGQKSVRKSSEKLCNLQPRVHEQSYGSSDNDSDSDCAPNGRNLNGSRSARSSPVSNDRNTARSCPKEASVTCNGNEPDSLFDISSIEQLKFENRELTESLKQMEDDITSFTEKLVQAEKKLEQANKEEEALVDLFSEERSRRDGEEEVLRNKLKDASITIQGLLQKLGSNRSSRGGC